MTLAKWEKESFESSQSVISTMISALGSGLVNSISHHVLEHVTTSTCYVLIASGQP